MDKLKVAESKFIRADGRDFLFLPEDKAIFEVDQEIKEIMTALSARQDMSKDQILSAMPGLTEDKQELLEELVDRRVLVSEGNGYAAHRGMELVYESVPLKSMILHVTDACNLGCLYCYYDKDATRSRGKDGKMDQSVAYSALDYLFENSAGLDRLIVVFFGGEPLLNFGLIRKAVEYIRHRASETGKHVDYSITTNGTLLNPDISRFLQENEFSVTVSMDGFESIQDHWRPFPDGSPSYRVIVPKVRDYLQNAARPAVARVTLVDHAGQVPDIVDHLLGLGFIEAGVAPVTTGNPDYQLSGQQMELLLEKFRILSDRFVDYARQGQLYGFSNLIDLLVSLHQGEVKNYPCGAGLGLLSVGPGGSLYPCQRFYANEEFRLGDIYAGLDRKQVSRFRKETEICQKPECMSCWARNLCAGGCYNEAYVRLGSHLEPNLHYCQWIRKWSEIGLQAYCRLVSANPDFLEMLCRSRGYKPMNQLNG